MSGSNTPRYIRCRQGHVFDTTASAACPTCGQGAKGPADPADTKERVRRPGPEIYSRPLHFIWLVDCSGSMVGEKMASVNYAIRSVLPEMQEAAEANANVQVLVRVLAFSDGAHWHVADAVPLSQFAWADLKAVPQAPTDLGQALQLVAAQVASPPMPQRSLPPMLALLTDGQATDDFDAGLETLLAQPGGVKAVRVSIAIGGDADLAALDKFNSPGLKTLRANSATDLVESIKWVSTVLAAKPHLEDAALADELANKGPLVWGP